MQWAFVGLIAVFGLMLIGVSATWAILVGVSLSLFLLLTDEREWESRRILSFNYRRSRKRSDTTSLTDETTD